MKVRSYNFDGPVQLINLGDVHRGDQACDDVMFRRVIDYIKNTPNARWASTGDMLNVALRKGKLATIYHSMSLEKELAVMTSELRPIADKCLGFVGSNHHARVENEIGMSLDNLIARELEVPYLGDIGLIKINCKRNSYFVAMHHGIGQGHLKGGKANTLERMTNLIPSADIYLTGHTHTFMYFVNEVNFIDRKRDKLSTFQSYFVTTGHFLDWEDSYAPQLYLPPAPKGSAMLELGESEGGNRKDVRVSLFTG